MCLECREFVKRGDKILDLGCGSGIIGKAFQDFFHARVLGVDIQDNRITYIPFQIIDGKNLPFNDKSFDLVLISYVLHHSENPLKLLKEAKRVGKKIIVYEDLPEGFLSKLRCILHEIIYNLFFQKTDHKFNFKTKKEWKGVFEKLGLKVLFEKTAKNPFDFLDPGEKIIFFLE